MKPSCATHFSSEVLIVFVILLESSVAQISNAMPRSGGTPIKIETAWDPNIGERAFPFLRFPQGIELAYAGMFSPDAVFRPPLKFGMFAGEVNGEGIPPARGGATSGDAPPWMLLSNQRVVENLEPPAHSQARFSVHSRTATLRNQLITWIYGRPGVIRAPQHIVTDSQGRVVMSDPRGQAIHVLDPQGRSSFRIVTGKGYRVHVPAGIAVDSEDNIYVVDSEHGVVVVFDRQGSFLRYIGNYDGEPEYAGPDGIAIDRERKRMLLVDTPRNLLLELTLDGKEIKRTGKLRDGTGLDFEAPTDVAASHTHVFVLDRSGARVQVLDTELNPVGKFDLLHVLDPQYSRQNGLGADQEGNVYVSLYKSSLVRIYSPEGMLLATFGQHGTRVGEFASPQGLWIDSGNRLFVADAENGRVQMFQIAPKQ